MLSRNTTLVQGISTLYFWFRRDDETVELRILPGQYQYYQAVEPSS
ncbi:hypothetical protein [Hymenobacter siberiensis]|nr:hypothetical protein [Hymenobacter siberiensis]